MLYVLNSIRAYACFIVYDIPMFAVVIFFRWIDWPLNSLYTLIDEKVYLGAIPYYSHDIEYLQKTIGITSVVNLCREFSGQTEALSNLKINQLYIPTVDTSTPTFEDIVKAVQHIEQVRASGGTVLVHCKCGMGRSATIVLCYLIKVGRYRSLREAVEAMQHKRNEVSLDIIHYGPVLQFAQQIAGLHVQH